jgi:hypothetical protein
VNQGDYCDRVLCELDFFVTNGQQRCGFSFRRQTFGRFRLGVVALDVASAFGEAAPLPASSSASYFASIAGVETPCRLAMLMALFQPPSIAEVAEAFRADVVPVVLAFRDG